jgi:hypothetical protein
MCIEPSILSSTAIICGLYVVLDLVELAVMHYGKVIPYSMLLLDAKNPVELLQRLRWDKHPCQQHRLCLYLNKPWQN